MTKARFWNVWWTLTMISAALTLVVAAMEALGVFRDAGVVLSVVGLLVTMVFGLTASTRSALGEFSNEVVPRLVGIETRLQGTEARLDRIIALLDERLPRPAA